MVGSIFSIQLDVIGTFTVGVSSLIGQVNNEFSPTALAWNVSLDMGAMPTGQDAIFDVEVSTDHGDTWTAILPADGRLVISAGGQNYGSLTSFEVTTIAAGTWVRCVCIQAGSGTAGSGLQVNCYGSEA